MDQIDALVCVEPGTLRIEKRPAPRPLPDHVLVRPRRVGVCGTDYHILAGKHPFLQYPRVIGHELAAEVLQASPAADVAVGEIVVINPYLACLRCVACRKGMPNCCVRVSVLGVHQDGGLAEALSVPARNIVSAGGLSLDQCALVEFLAIGAHAVRRARVAENERVLVVGAGPIGIGTALFARLSGAVVAVIDVVAERTATARDLTGATALLPDDNQLAEFTSGEGFDVVFDATGNRHAMEKGFDYATHGGRYVLVGVIKDSITFKDPDFHRKELTLLASRNATLEDFERVVTGMREGKVPGERMITHRTDFRKAVTDIPLWAAKKSGLVKAVVELD